MKTILIISIFAFMECVPINDVVEIEKQNLIRFPEDSNLFESPQSETQRILEEIEKINIKLGYKKNRNPSLFHSNQYLYSKPSFNSFGVGLLGGGKLEPSIRSILPKNSSKNQVKDNKSKIYTFPIHFTGVSKNRFIKSTNASIKLTNGYKIIGNFNNSNHLLKSSGTSPIENKNVKVFLIPFYDIKQENKLKNTSSENIWKAINVKNYKNKNSTPVERTSSHHNSKPNNENRPTSIYSNIPKPLNQKKEPSIILQSIKSSINSLLSKPTIKPVKQNIIANKINNSTDFKEESKEYYNDSEEKTFFPSMKKYSKKNQNETFKDGGIIIQRLKVRKGGIAIAGPGGIATAGSGGTAIVGPGGFALTHPKSLTIAGPGAKILAYPSETDLKEVLVNSNNNDKLLQNGKLVATGPAIYYNNEN